MRRIAVARASRRQSGSTSVTSTALVLPAGNTFLDRLHGLIYRSDFVNDAAQFYWRIQPNDRTPSYLEIWFWHGFNPHGYRIETVQTSPGCPLIDSTSCRLTKSQTLTMP